MASRGTASLVVNIGSRRYQSSWAALSHVKKVGIIGGGVAGLQAARALAAHGLQPKVFEKSNNVGGVWRENYSGFGVQVPKQLYEFPDYPFPVPAGYYPTGPETQKYIEDYAKHFNILDKVKLNTAATSVSQRSDGQRGWTVTTRSKESGAETKEDVDFLVVSTGMYNNPFTPTFVGQAEFAGKIMHSSKFTDASIAKGKRVLVVGGGKSAIDIAIEASKGNAEKPTLLYRNAHWGTPRKIAGLIPFQYVFLSRFGQALVSWYKGGFPTAPQSVKTAHSVLKGIMGPIFGIVEALFAFQLGQRGDYKPEMDVVKDFYGYAQVLDTQLKDLTKAGKIDAIKGTVARLTPTGAVLTDGRSIPADLIICATGFTKAYSFLPASTVKALDVQKDGLYLYRHAVPVNVPDLAFVGSEVATISNIATHGIQAEWLARLLKGGHQLPAASQMQQAVDTHKAWARGWMPETEARASLVLLHQIHFHDALFKDMGVAHRRKGANVLAELFMPYQPQDYNGFIKYQ